MTGRVLYRIDHYSSLPGTAVLVALALAAGLVLGGGLGFSSGWESGFSLAMGVVTLMMVVVVQHTQTREQIATQRKLDELLRALPQAESGLMMLEEASEDELRSVEVGQRALKADVSDGIPAPPPGAGSQPGDR
jgi:low affinity Fe/Cu permease